VGEGRRDGAEIARVEEGHRGRVAAVTAATMKSGSSLPYTLSFPICSDRYIPIQ
jgi:hypothetical protein